MRVVDSSQSAGNDRAVGDSVQDLDAAMLDRQAELRIDDPGARAGASVSTTTRRRLTFCAPVHPRGILLADEAALGETDAVQFGRIALEPEQVAEFGAAFADAEAQPVFEPAARRFAGGRKPAAAKVRKSRIGTLSCRPSTNAPRARVALDADRATQPIDQKALDQIVGCGRLAIEQQIVAIRPDEKIEQAFALRRQQPRPDRQVAGRRRW